MESMDFEIATLKPISRERLGRHGSRLQGVLNECDALFTLSPGIAIESRSADLNLALICTYLMYNLQAEAAEHSARMLTSRSHELTDFQISKLSEIASLV
jgi:hypothetical protein